MRRRLLLGLLATMLLGACSAWREPTVPMRTIAEPARCSTRPDTLLVLLPGMRSLPEEFQREGFVQAVRDRQIAADVLLVDAHWGYYDNRSIVDRLRADVIQPARLQGYRHIWLAGISLGGVGAMLYAEAWAGEVDGVVMLAPYLGTLESAQQIQSAGGLAAWQAPPDGDDDVRLWRWLQVQTQHTADAKKLPLYLGYGQSDRFAFNAEVLRQALPAGRVFTTAGGHDWDAWTVLWQAVLDAGALSSIPCVRGAP
ncbi:MAG TPA: alpha/beta hydrolase [Rhizobacter sp.]|nr:alpha/beta hydrolase [Rhizobacter sp.]